MPNAKSPALGLINAKPAKSPALGSLRSLPTRAVPVPEEIAGGRLDHVDEGRRQDRHVDVFPQERVQQAEHRLAHRREQIRVGAVHEHGALHQQGADDGQHRGDPEPRKEEGHGQVHRSAHF